MNTEALTNQVVPTLWKKCQICPTKIEERARYCDPCRKKKAAEKAQNHRNRLKAEVIGLKSELFKMVPGFDRAMMDSFTKAVGELKKNAKPMAKESMRLLLDADMCPCCGHMFPA